MQNPNNTVHTTSRDLPHSEHIRQTFKANRCSQTSDWKFSMRWDVGQISPINPLKSRPGTYKERHVSGPRHKRLVLRRSHSRWGHRLWRRCLGSHQLPLAKSRAFSRRSRLDQARFRQSCPWKRFIIVYRILTFPYCSCFSIDFLRNANKGEDKTWASFGVCSIGGHSVSTLVSGEFERWHILFGHSQPKW